MNTKSICRAPYNNSLLLAEFLYRAVRIVKPKLAGLAQVVNAYVLLIKLNVGYTSIIIRLGKVGVKLYRLVVISNRLHVVIGPGVQVAAVELQVGVVRIKHDGRVNI